MEAAISTSSAAAPMGAKRVLLGLNSLTSLRIDREIDPNRKKLLSSLQLREDLPPFYNIRPFPEFVRGHHHEQLLSRQIPALSAAEARALRWSDDLGPKIGIVKGWDETENRFCGSLPASLSPTHWLGRKCYSMHQWVRDTVYGILGLLAAGRTDEAFLLVEEVARYYAARRNIFHEFHYYDKNPPQRFRELQGVPYIRQIIDPLTGKPVDEATLPDGDREHAAKWHHGQIDSVASFLWLVSRLANKEEFDLGALNHKLSEEFHLNKEDSIFSMMATFLHRVTCVPTHHGSRERVWSQVSVGPWETEPAWNRLSELAPFNAACREFYKYLFRNGGADRNSGIRVYDRNQLRADLNEAIHLSQIQIDHRISSVEEGRAIETTRPDGSPVFDASCVTALYPFELELDRNQKLNVLATFFDLMKEDAKNGIYAAPGTKRFDGDIFSASDFHVRGDKNYNVHEDTRGKEARWLIFIRQVAGACLREANELFDAEIPPPEAFAFYRYGVSCFLQGLAQVTSNSASYKIAIPKEFWKDQGVPEYFPIHSEPGEYPESFFFNSEQGIYVPTPPKLQWTASLEFLVRRQLERACIAKERADKRMRDYMGGEWLQHEAEIDRGQGSPFF
jgi:hypothetical protein